MRCRESDRLTHLALQVPDLNDAFARLTAECAAPVVTEPGAGATGGVRYAYVHDPEGNLIELIESIEASPIRTA